VKKSLTYFNRAIELDPGFARAHATAAFTYEYFALFAILPQREAYPKAKALAKRARELDGSLVEAHAILGDVAVYDCDWPLAEASYKRAIALNPNSPFVLDGYAIGYPTPWGRHDESIAALRRAIELDPNASPYRGDLVVALMLAQRNEETIEEAKRALEREPNLAWAWWSLGVAYSEKGAHDAAIEAFKKHAAIVEQNFDALGGLGYVYGRAGKRDEALKVLATMKERAKKETFDPFGFAWVYLGLDDHDAALGWFQKAYDERPNYNLPYMKVGPFLQSDSLRPAIYRTVEEGRAGEVNVAGQST
jgi:adenylate cyclase